MKLIKMKEGRKKGKESGREGLLCGRIYYFREMSYAIWSVIFVIYKHLKCNGKHANFLETT